MQRVLIIAFIIGIADAVASTNCRDDYTSFRGSCYHFGHVQGTYTESEHYCRQRGGHLADIMTSLENDFVKNHAREMQTHHWWTGLNDQVVEGHFIWDDDDTEATFTEWGTNQPEGGGEDCVALDYQDGYMWGDFPCTMQLFPVCKAQTKRRRDYRVAAS
ncbi:brevican core protein-like isoform X3 [Dreissena polymorpha]|uniref:brevican core protein-like isoform X3 n=1 Tax=Dreissena polymorpha TaxID=45954 RepID=UPI00226522F0|nr:brevican core protein-like isoform X3 [Dreissena polymorpha]